MKKTIMLLIMSLLLCTFAFADSHGGASESMMEGNGTMMMEGENMPPPPKPELMMTHGDNMTTPEPRAVMAEGAEPVRTQMRERHMIMNDTPKLPERRQEIASSGEYMTPEGKKLKIMHGEQKRYQFETNGVMADADFELIQDIDKNKTRLRAKLSNGRNAEIKVMPDRASKTALERLRMKVCAENCTIELKEVGQGNQTRLSYELKAQRKSRLFGMFPAKMNVTAEVDAETGELIRSRKPWWAFLAAEPEE